MAAHRLGRVRRRRVVAAAVVAAATAALPLVPADAGMEPRGQDAPVAPPVLAPATPASGPTAGSRPYAAVLGPALAAAGLRGRVSASVVDLATGRQAWTLAGSTARTPASVTKLLTAAAVLDQLGPDHVFTTRVVTGSARGRVVLVGAGDPLLSATRGTLDTGVRRTPIDTLARRTVAALRAMPAAQRPARVLVDVDDALFGPPSTPAAWPRTYVGAGVAGKVDALSLDGGRVRPDRDARVDDPGLAAGRVFAERVTQRGVPATLGKRVPSAAGALELAAVESQTLGRIVEHTLDVSDNDAAEVLGRQVAVAARVPATATGAPAAIRSTLSRLGVDLGGARLVDASGLARSDAVRPATVTAVLAAAADQGGARLGPLLTGLPVAGFTGTLADRYRRGPSAAAQGVVRAKTGSLTGVSTLAGTTLARDGHTYAFAFLASGVAGVADPTRAALDAAAAALTGCGCL